MEKGISVRTALAGALIFFVFYYSYHAKGREDQTLPEHIPGEVVVSLENNVVGPAMQSAAMNSISSSLVGHRVLSIENVGSNTLIQKIKLNSSKGLSQAITQLRSNPYVRYAEPNYIYRQINQPNDTMLGKLWGLKNSGQAISGKTGVKGADVNVASVWAAGNTGSRKVVVAVIDSGVDWDHEDLKANIYTNAAESGAAATDGVDNDGNGYVDDTHGWDFVKNSRDSTDNQNVSHGTHCAGTIGAVGNNSTGVVGVNWEVSLMPVKFLGDDGSGSLAAAISSIDYATKMKVDIMSNSWGGGGFSKQLEDAIKRARDAGILFVAAAGNGGLDGYGDNIDNTPVYPASYNVENVLAVAAVDNQNSLAKFSNYGQKKVHIAAPGVNVWSTVDTKDSTGAITSYAAYSGTSMATPHVSGAAALMLSIDSSLTYKDLKKRIIESAKFQRNLQTKTVAGGTLDVAEAIKGTVTTPGGSLEESDWSDIAFTSETDHPYQLGKTYEFEVHEPGAKFLRVYFKRMEVETNYDYVEIVNPVTGTVYERYTGTQNDFYSVYVEGEKLLVRFVSDRMIGGWGLHMTKAQAMK